MNYTRFTKLLIKSGITDILLSWIFNFYKLVKFWKDSGISESSFVAKSKIFKSFKNPIFGLRAFRPHFPTLRMVSFVNFSMQSGIYLKMLPLSNSSFKFSKFPIYSGSYVKRLYFRFNILNAFRLKISLGS